MTITIRPAGPDDIADLIALDSVALTDAERREHIADWVADGACHLAQVGGRTVGYVALTRSFFHSAFIEMLMVARDGRRAGVGRALLGYCLQLVPPDEKLWTSTNQSNAPMRALLLSAGFQPSGHVDNLDDGDPELIFVHLPASE